MEMDICAGLNKKNGAMGRFVALQGTFITYEFSCVFLKKNEKIFPVIKQMFKEILHTQYDP